MDIDETDIGKYVLFDTEDGSVIARIDKVTEEKGETVVITEKRVSSMNGQIFHINRPSVLYINRLEGAIIFDVNNEEERRGVIENNFKDHFKGAEEDRFIEFLSSSKSFSEIALKTGSLRLMSGESQEFANDVSDIVKKQLIES